MRFQHSGLYSSKMSTGLFMANLIFETERLYVRQFTADDEQYFFDVNGSEEVMYYIRAAKTREECNEFLKETILGYEISPQTGRWAIFSKTDDRFVGLFAVIPLQNSNDLQIGYAFLKNEWGKGFATESLLAGVQYVFEKMNLPRIMAIVTAANLASEKVLVKAGFQKKDVLLDKQAKLNLYQLLNPLAS